MQNVSRENDFYLYENERAGEHIFIYRLVLTQKLKATRTKGSA